MSRRVQALWASIGALWIAIGGVGGARASDPIWAELPLAGLMRGELDGSSNEALGLRAEALRQRLFIDEQTVSLERGEDLELAIAYAATVALVAERHAARDGIEGATRSAAFALHAVGFAVETSFDLKIALAELSELDSPAARALVASTKVARRVGRARFEAAFAAIAEPSATALGQAGRVALCEGTPMKAAEYFMAATAKTTLPRFAVAACEALLRTEDLAAVALCERLEARFVAALPASANAFVKVRREVSDALASKRFRDDGALESVAAEVWRRLRLGRLGAAETLAKVAVERWGLAGRRLLAAVAVAMGRPVALDGLAGPDGLGHGDARIAELAVAAEARRAVEVLLGRGRGPKVTLEPLIDAYAGDAEVVAQLRLLAALVAQTEGVDAGDAWQRFVSLAGKRGDSARLGLFAALARGRWQEDVAGLLASLDGDVRRDADGVAARVELGLALRARDGERLAAVAKRLVGDAPAMVLARVVARRAREVLSGEALVVAGLADDRLALATLAFTFDETTPVGQRLAQARAFTLATLEGRAKGANEAAELLREARRFGGPLAALGGGLAQLLAHDGQGAYELCGRAVSADAVLGHALSACRVLGLPSKAAWRALEDGWDAAGLPPVLRPGTARPLFAPEVAMGVDVERGLVLQVEFDGVSLLLPELLGGRAEVRERGQD